MALTRITKGVIKPNENYDTHNINSTGIVTAVGANFSGNVSVGGVLTYEDVTNIDSVGIITARQGIFIDDSITHIGDTNTKIRFPADDTISFETAGSEKLRIKSTGQVGIGTTNPSSQLHIYSGDSGDCILTLESDTDNVGSENDNPYIKFVQDGGIEESVIGMNPFALSTENNSLILANSVANNGGIIFKTGTVNGYTNATERLRITTNGNVGIGTNNPGKLLEIFGTDPTIKLRDSSGDAYVLIEGDSADQGSIRFRADPLSAGANTHIRFDVDGNEALRITSGGDLIHTSNDKTFSLVDTRNLSNAGTKIAFFGANRYDTDEEFAAIKGLLVSNSGGSGKQNGSLQFIVGSASHTHTMSQAGYVGIGTGTPQALLHLQSDGTSASNTQGLYFKNGPHDVVRQYFANGNDNSDFVITYDGTGGAEITLKQAGNVVLNESNGGKTVIGYTPVTPTNPLTIAGASASAILEIQRTSANSTGAVGAVNFTAIDGHSVANIYALGDGNSDGAHLIFKTTSAATENSPYGTGTLERVRINSSGNVGINTNDPKSRLDIRGDININNNTIISNFDSNGVGGGNIDHFYHDDSPNYGTGGTWNFVSDGTYKATGNSTLQAGFVNSSGGGNFLGNVGIGLTSPEGRLHISSGTSGDCELIIESDTDNNNENDNPRIVFKQDGGSAQAAIEQLDNELTISNSVATSGGIIFKTGTTSPYTNATERLRIHHNGNVMIGSGTPSTQLHVQNSSSVVRVESTSTSTSARLEITGASNSYSGLHFGDSSDHDIGYIRYYNNEDYMILGTNTKERVKILNDGQVNIGGSNEVQLTANNDYVLYLHGAITGANIDGAYGQRIILDDDDVGTTSAGDRERGSIYANFNGNASGGNTTDETRAWNIWSDLNTTADYDLAYGVYADVRTTHTSGTMTSMRGCYGLVQTANSGTVTEMIGVYGIAQPTTGSSGTVSDVIGVKARANMAAGTSTVSATDLVGVWGQIDNDNDATQGTGGKCALFYGNYDKTTNLHQPQGIRIDTDVPNYFRGGIAINGGGNFLPSSNHAIHIRNNTNATGIYLQQTGDQYNVIRGDANRSGADNAILDIQGYWNTTQVGRIRIDTGADTTNKDDGRMQFFTAAAGTLTERMRIQENGEIAMRSSGTPSDALANLHVQNETFRVSNDGDGANTTYIALTAHNNSTDGDRNIYKHVKGSVIKSQITNAGHVFSHSSHYAGRTRTDVNSPANVYSNGSHNFTAYSGTTNNTAAYRGSIMMRAWDGGDTGDRNILYYTDSGSDTVANDYDQHQYFGVKANGMTQIGSHLFVGRIESDEGSPNSVYRGVNGTAVIVYPTSGSQYTRIDARTTDNTEQVIKIDTGGGVVFKVESNGNVEYDGGLNSPASDYAEYFEWTDGNTSNADRRGITVVLDGEKIRPATDSDDKSKILGVVSALPVVVGDSAWSEWQLAHLKDAYGSFITKDEEFLVWNKFGTFTDADGVKKPNPQPDINDPNMQSEFQCLVSEIDVEKEKGNVPQAAIDQNFRVTRPSRTYNPDYDPTRTYVPRSQRKEWDAIGLLGKLVVRRGQPIGTNWILMKSNVGTDPNDSSIILDKYLVR